MRATGAAVTIGYAVLLGWLAASQPQSFAEVSGGLAASIGAYEANAVDFEEGRRLFLRDQFEAARSAWARADPAGRPALPGGRVVPRRTGRFTGGIRLSGPEGFRASR